VTDQAYTGVDNLEAMVEARRYNAFLTDAVLRAAGEARSALDFGAGVGTFAAMVRERGLDVSCVEVDADLRRVLSERGFTAYAGLEAVAADSVPFAYSLNVLEHIEDDAAALRALASRLVPGGRVLLYVPAFQVLYSSMDRKVGHFRRYRRAGLLELVRAAGLQPERAEYVDSLGWLASLVFKAIGNAEGDLSPRSVALYDRFVFPASRLLDLGLNRLLGKNLLVVASRRARATEPSWRSAPST
jgi:SAM-dependent methyltransferase